MPKNKYDITFAQVVSKYPDTYTILNSNLQEIFSHTLNSRLLTDPLATRLDWISTVRHYFPFLNLKELKVVSQQIAKEFGDVKQQYTSDWKHRLPNLFKNHSKLNSPTVFDFIDMHIEDTSTTPVKQLQSYLVTIQSLDSNKLSCKYTVSQNTVVEITKLVTNSI